MYTVFLLLSNRLFSSNHLLCLPLQIFDLLRIPMNRPSGPCSRCMRDHMDKRYESIRCIFQLCYRVIQRSQKAYWENQVICHEIALSIAGVLCLCEHLC